MSELQPYPVGAIVKYHGSGAQDAKDYVITARELPRPGIPEPGVNYPDGVAYVIWPVGVLQKWGNRHLSVVQVRRGSITPASTA